MAAQAGLDVVVSVKDDEGTPAYQAIGGLRNSEISFNQEMIDITNVSSTGLYRELLGQGGVRSFTVSGTGVFIDDTAAAEIKDAWAETELRDVSFLVPDFGTFEAPCLVTSFSYASEFNGEVTFNVTFESGGTISFSAA